MSGSKGKKMKRFGSGRVMRRAMGFRREEGGAMIIFGLTIFVMMMWVGGMAIDFMRFEYDRSRVQYTLDRAALAAASLSQSEDCEAVALDYFEKSGINTSQVSVVSDCVADVSKTVQISARTEVRSMFLNLLGIDQMVASGTSTAEESTQDVEISLVLDVSGSMSELDSSGNQTKLAALQTASKEFLDTLLTTDNIGRVSINIIPYSMQVNVGEDVLDQLNVTDEHNYSHCVDFEDADFRTVEISDDVAGALSLGEISLDASPMGNTNDLQRTGHFDPYYTTINHPNTNADDDENRLFVCPTSEASRVTLMSQNGAQLGERIDALEPGGNTSIDLGVKWGSYFLNPKSQLVLSTMPETSENFASDENTTGIASAFGERPYEYGRDNTLKILVVMTDGINTTQYTLDEDYAEGDSTLWWDPNGDQSNNTWMSHYKQRPGWNNDYFMSRGNYFEDYFSGSRRNQGSDEQLSWQEVWAMMGVKYFAYYYNYARDWDVGEYWDTRNAIMDSVSATAKNDRLNDACNAAKDEEVIIYTIGFEVSDESAVVMESCASSASNFFRVEGTEISEAFGEIANAIQRLKLTF
jgi:Flp pilus assembly protein TadG